MRHLKTIKVFVASEDRFLNGRQGIVSEQKTDKGISIWGALALSIWMWSAFTAQAQIPPAITIQPVSQTNLAGSDVTFSVAVQGTGPFSYQWQMNGTNLPAVITTVAGNGIGGFSGDGGLAVNASLNWPSGVCIDWRGNIYIADENNNRVRKVDANGVITTIAGIGPLFPQVGGYSGDGGPATNAALYGPQSLVIDNADRLYIVDVFNSAFEGLMETVS